MYKNIKNNKGFTIIEVLIVFLAVPALQRSARNQSRKSDVASIAGAVNGFITNNNGSVPAGFCTGTAPNDVVVFQNVTLTGPTPSQTKVGYYNQNATVGGINASHGNCGSTGGGATGNSQLQFLAAAGAFSGGSSNDHVSVQMAAQCSGATIAGQGTATPTLTPAAGSAKQFAVVYQIETGSGTYSAECTDS